MTVGFDRINVQASMKEKDRKEQPQAHSVHSFFHHSFSTFPLLSFLFFQLSLDIISRSLSMGEGRMNRKKERYAKIISF